MDCFLFASCLMGLLGFFYLAARYKAWRRRSRRRWQARTLLEAHLLDAASWRAYQDLSDEERELLFERCEYELERLDGPDC